jgi:hypothetical protein
MRRYEKRLGENKREEMRGKEERLDARRIELMR